MITIENADKALKEYYLKAVSAQLNDGISPFFAAIEKTAENISGKEVNIAVVRGNSGNIKACAEDGELPDPYKNRYLSITSPLKNIYGAIEVSDKVLRASRDNSGAFVNIVNAEMEGLVASARQNFQRMLYGDGSGQLCKVLSVVDEYTFKVDNLREFYVGMQIDIVPAAGQPSEGKGVYIVAIDRKNSTIKINTENNDPVLNATVCVHGSQGNELTGLGAIFGSSVLYGYDKSEEPYFAPYIADAENSLTEEMLCDVLDYMEENFNSKINMILCSYKTRKKIAALIADRKRVVNTIDARTGTGVVTVNDVPAYADKYCPEGEILFVNTDDFVLSQLCDWEWLEDESGKILKQIPGKAAYGATLVKYAELICKKPCGQAKIINV